MCAVVSIFPEEKDAVIGKSRELINKFVNFIKFVHISTFFFLQIDEKVFGEGLTELNFSVSTHMK